MNVNLPREPRGLVWTRVSVRQYDGVIVPTRDPLGREMYWFSVTPIEGAEEGTDRWAVEQQWISMTPLRVDLTDEPRLALCMAQHPTGRGDCLGHIRAAIVARGRESRESGRGFCRPGGWTTFAGWSTFR